MLLDTGLQVFFFKTRTQLKKVTLVPVSKLELLKIVIFKYCLDGIHVSAPHQKFLCPFAKRKICTMLQNEKQLYVLTQHYNKIDF